MSDETQQRRTKRVASAVTETERIALDGLAKARGVSVSELLHQMSIQGATEAYHKLMDDLIAGEEVT